MIGKSNLSHGLFTYGRIEPARVTSDVLQRGHDGKVIPSRPKFHPEKKSKFCLGLYQHNFILKYALKYKKDARKAMTTA